MQKKKTKTSSLSHMAKKIINDIDRLLERKIIYIDEIRKAHRIAEELECKSILTLSSSSLTLCMRYMSMHITGWIFWPNN